MVRTFIALGSNLNNPHQQVLQALHTLKNHPHLKHIKTSKIYRNHALGDLAQPDYINAVVELDCTLSAHELLEELNEIELAQGRIRKDETKWGPRTLDLDLLLYGDNVIHTARLIVPHPEMTKRNFVLYPLADIDPELVFPDGKTLALYLKNVSKDGLVAI